MPGVFVSRLLPLRSQLTSMLLDERSRSKESCATILRQSSQSANGRARAALMAVGTLCVGTQFINVENARQSPALATTVGAERRAPCRARLRNKVSISLFFWLLHRFISAPPTLANLRTHPGAQPCDTLPPISLARSVAIQVPVTDWSPAAFDIGFQMQTQLTERTFGLASRQPHSSVNICRSVGATPGARASADDSRLLHAREQRRPLRADADHQNSRVYEQAIVIRHLLKRARQSLLHLDSFQLM